MKTLVSRLALLALSLAPCTLPATAQQVLRLPGTTPVGSSASTGPVTIVLPTGGFVDAVKAVTQGAESSDFRILSESCKAAAFGPGQTCTVDVSFTPTTPGERRGAVVLLDSAKRTLAARPLAGTASGAVATFIPGIISTYAGNSLTFLYNGDGGQAVNASLFLPSGVAFDGAGNLLIADTYNRRIRKVTASTGIMTTIAGDGGTAYAADGVPALNTGLNNPSSIAIDGAGDIYVADTYNNAVRVINASTGLISTVAGTGTAGYLGDNAPAILAELNTPNGLAFDANGNLYIADTGNNAIREVNLTTGVISTVAGTGIVGSSGDGGQAKLARLNAPWGITLSPAGALYIADQGNNSVRMVDTTGVITRVTGGGNASSAGDGGPASAGRLSAPSNVLLDVAGNLYISDTQNNRIRKINAGTQIITTIAGSGGNPDNNPATLASLYGPYGMALDSSGSLYIADAAHNRVRKVASNMAVLNYPILRAGSVSAAETQILENDGTNPLNVGAVTAVANAQVDPTTTCNSSSPLAPYAQCTITAEFAPATTNVVGTISVTSDALNAPGSLKLQGGVQSTYPASVLLNSSPNPSITGNAVLFSVQVVNSGGIVATGTITLLDGTATIGTAQLSNGNALFSISNLSIGQHSITASYSGDTNDTAGVSTALIQVVTAPPPNSSTTTVLTSSANPSNVGQTLNLNATVAPVASGQAVPTGTVNFLDGTTLIGTATLNAGTASIGTAALTVGTHQLTAVFTGSSSYTTSTSAVLTQVVIAPNTVTTTSLLSSADPIGVGSLLTLSTVVSPASAGQPTPTGTVSFMEGTTVLGTSTLASGAASFTTSTLSVGTHLLTAIYSGSSTYTGSTSPVLTQIVVATSTGNTPQFTLTAVPGTLSLKTGSHGTIQIQITTQSTFADTLSFGCGALPVSATCTFLQPTLQVAGGTSQTTSFVIDTGNPLGSGSSAKLQAPNTGLPRGVLACFLPAGALLAFLLRKRNTMHAIRWMILLGSLAVIPVLSGCGSSTTVSTTPAGTYSIQVFANGSSTGASYVVPVTLTVTN